VKKRHAVLVVLSACALSALTLGSPALAREGDVLARGSCSAGSTSKLKLSEENGRIEIEFEVDQNRNGVSWKVVIARGGQRVATLTRTTRAPSGSFEARKVIANGAGTDVVRATATRAGESCTVKAILPG